MMEVCLKPLRASDIDDNFISWHQNNDGHLDYYTGTRKSFSEARLREWISGAEKQDIRFYLIIVDENVPIGTVKIGPIDRVNKTSDLVCLIGDRRYLGKGIAATAIRKASSIAFNELDIRRLHGGMYETNIASIKAYCKAGWEIEGRMPGYYWYDNKAIDRVCVACLNPLYFSDSKIK